MYSSCKIFLHLSANLANNYLAIYLTVNLLKFTAQSLTCSNQTDKDTNEENTLYKSQY